MQYSSPRQQLSVTSYIGIFLLFLALGALLAQFVIRLITIPHLISLLTSLSGDGILEEIYIYMLEGVETALWAIAVTGFLASALLLWGRNWGHRASVLLLSLSPSYFLSVLLILSLFVNLVLLMLIPYEPWVDFKWYHQRAVELATGQGYIEQGQPTAFWPVGYPAFLALFYYLFGSSTLVAQLLNILLRVGIILLTYSLARRLLKEELIARLAAILVAFLPSLMFYSLIHCSDVLFTFLFLVALEWTSRVEHPRWPITFSLGLLLAATTLVRPVILLFPIVMLLWYWMRTGKRLAPSVTHSLAAALLMVAMLLPWAYRNYQVFDRFVLVSTNGGINLYLGNHPGTSGLFHDIKVQYPAWVSNEAERDAYLRDLAIQHIREDPIRTLGITLKKLLILFVKDDQGVSFASRIHFARIPAPLLLLFTLLSNLYYYILLALVARFLFLKGRGIFKDQGVLFLLLSSLYIVLVYLPFIVPDRFHLPILPLFCILAAASLVRPPAHSH